MDHSPPSPRLARLCPRPVASGPTARSHLRHRTRLYPGPLPHHQPSSSRPQSKRPNQKHGTPWLECLSGVSARLLVCSFQLQRRAEFLGPQGRRVTSPRNQKGPDCCSWDTPGLALGPSHLRPFAHARTPAPAYLRPGIIQQGHRHGHPLGRLF